MTKLLTIPIFIIFAIFATSSHGHGVVVSPADRCQETSDLVSLAASLSDKDNHAQLQSLTNILHATFGSQNLCDVDIQQGCYLLKRTLALPSVRNDPNALYYCAQTISSAEGISTNSYTNELFDAYYADMALRKNEPRKPGSAVRGKYWGTRQTAVYQKWTPILEHNRILCEFRKKGVVELREALNGYFKDHDENANNALKSRICTLEKLSKGELKYLIGEEFFRRANATDAEKQMIR